MWTIFVCLILMPNIMFIAILSSSSARKCKGEALMNNAQSLITIIDVNPKKSEFFNQQL